MIITQMYKNNYNYKIFYFEQFFIVRCGNRRKFGADQSKTKLFKNQQSGTSVQ
jgi:hypothetical protein